MVGRSAAKIRIFLEEQWLEDTFLLKGEAAASRRLTGIGMDAH